MNFSKMNHPITVILSFILLFPSSSIHATEYYAFRVTGSDCTLCHTNSQTGSLNQTGTLFQEEGYRYPLTWKGILSYCLWGLPLFFILFGFYHRYRLWRLGKDGAEWNHWKERGKGLIVSGFGHRCILRSPFPGISHFLLNETRVKQAAEIGVEIIATVCPLCMISLDSAVKVLNLDNRIQVMDILELLRERIKNSSETKIKTPNS